MAVTVAPNDLECDLHRLAHNTSHGLRDQALHACAQPLFDELRWHADYEASVPQTQSFGVLEPGVIVGPGDVDLQLAEGSIPDSLGSRVRHEDRLRLRGFEGADGGTVAHPEARQSTILCQCQRQDAVRRLTYRTAKEGGCWAGCRATICAHIITTPQ